MDPKVRQVVIFYIFVGFIIVTFGFQNCAPPKETPEDPNESNIVRAIDGWFESGGNYESICGKLTNYSCFHEVVRAGVEDSESTAVECFSSQGAEVCLSVQTTITNSSPESESYLCYNSSVVENGDFPFVGEASNLSDAFDEAHNACADVFSN